MPRSSASKKAWWLANAIVPTWPGGEHSGQSAPLERQLFLLPKYSPDLNPIEQVFAKLKHLLRKATARTVDAVCAAIGHALDAFTPEECANYLKNSGYRT